MLRPKSESRLMSPREALTSLSDSNERLYRASAGTLGVRLCGGRRDAGDGDGAGEGK